MAKYGFSDAPSCLRTPRLPISKRLATVMVPSSFVFFYAASPRLRTLGARLAAIARPCRAVSSDPRGRVYSLPAAPRPPRCVFGPCVFGSRAVMGLREPCHQKTNALITAAAVITAMGGP